MSTIFALQGMEPPVAHGCAEGDKVAALQQLLASHVPGESSDEQLSATQLRDRLIAHDPGNASWIALINKVHACRMPHQCLQAWYDVTPWLLAPVVPA